MSGTKINSYLKVTGEKSDGSIKFEKITEEVLFGTFFFLSNNKNIHKRDVQNIFNLLSSYGGLVSAVISVTSIIGAYVNQCLFMGYFISKNFLFKIDGHPLDEGKSDQPQVEKENGDKVDCDLVPIQFSLGDKFAHIKLKFCQVFCCKCMKPQKSYMKKSELAYIRGYEIAEKEFDYINILENIEQLKAGLITLTKNTDNSENFVL